MSRLIFTKVAAPATPASNKVAVYVDTADKRVKAIDDAGVISVLSDDGLSGVDIIDNGGMRIQQRLATASAAIAGISTTTRAGQVADRFAVTTSVASNLNWAQIDTAGTQEVGLQSRFYGSIISSSAGKKVMLSQVILSSDMSYLRGKKVRVSIKHNQKVGSGQTYRMGLLQLTNAGTVDTMPAFLTGAWSTTSSVDPAWGTNLSVIAPDASPTGENGTVGASWLTITSVATTWTKSSAVFTTPTSAKNLVFVFFSDATGGTTDNISLTEVMVTQGTEIVDYTPFPAAIELARCQRFFSKSFSIATVPAQNLGVTTGNIKWTAGVAGAVAGTWGRAQFPVEMWKAPAVTLYNPAAANAQVRQIGATAGDCATSSAAQITTQSTDFTTTPGASAVVGTILGVHYSAEADFIT